MYIGNLVLLILNLSLVGVIPRCCSSMPASRGRVQKVGSGIDYLDRDEFRPWWDADSRTTEDAVRAIGKVQ